MPPKDDDDPASTKEVVTKKQKQLLNREELDLNLIAESLGGFVIESRRNLSLVWGKSLVVMKRFGVERIFGKTEKIKRSQYPKNRYNNTKRLQVNLSTVMQDTIWTSRSKRCIQKMQLVDLEEN